MARIPALCVAGLVRVYQILISPLIHALGGPGSGCRFTPSCSEYARQALHEHGLFRGGWMAVRRIARCHPWSRGGFDPVVPSKRSRSGSGEPRWPGG